MSGPKQRVSVARTEALGALLERLGEPRALEEGRVFVNGRRAEKPEDPLSLGDLVEVYAARQGASPAKLLHCAQGLAFVEKPVGIATEPEKRGASTSLAHSAAALLGVKPEELHALSRLDVGVSGVVLFAFTRDAARRIQRAREDNSVRRRYIAIAAGLPEPRTGAWTDPIGRDPRGPLRRVRADGERAYTGYRVCGVVPSLPASVLAFDPKTGRTHQLRVHAAAHGAPFYGDRSYGGPTRLVRATGAVEQLERVYLHAAWLDVPGFERVHSALPPEFRDLWGALGGEPSALVAALEDEPTRN